MQAEKLFSACSCSFGWVSSSSSSCLKKWNSLKCATAFDYEKTFLSRKINRFGKPWFVKRRRLWCRFWGRIGDRSPQGKWGGVDERKPRAFCRRRTSRGYVPDGRLNCDPRPCCRRFSWRSRYRNYPWHGDH